MTRDEALDLLPLLAGGELDEEAAAAVQIAVQLAGEEGDPTLMAELESYRSLDAALATAYAPEAAAPDSPASAIAEVPARAALVVVRRRCPYCHDTIQAEALVVCASCATPHHAPCFEAHEGCSLLGCGSSASIAASGPLSVVCRACTKHTPQGAPFCAWCGADVHGQGAAAPRHTRPTAETPFDWRRYAAAAALLLASTFGVGGMFGVQQAGVLAQGMGALAATRHQRAERAAVQFVESALALQRVHKDERGAYARSFSELRALRPEVGPEVRPPDDVTRLVRRLTTAYREASDLYEVELLTDPSGSHHCVILRGRSSARGEGYFADGAHGLSFVRGPFDVDPATLELRAPADAVSEVKDALIDWRPTWKAR